MKKAAKLIKPNRVVIVQGKQLTVVTTQALTTEVGEVVELTFADGTSIRRPQNAKLEVL